ncbi:MAG: FAD-dependent oxidoreductase, partial [Cyclobacteriaceae bacterium]
DIQSPKMFPDRVAYGGWPLDDHPPGGMNTTGVVPYISIPLKGPYSIPFKSLYAKSLDNLFLAGRNVSVSHVALSSTRVMATCATMGQAIGTAMAYCLQNNMGIRQLAEGQAMQKLQQLLLRQDQSILGVVNLDEKDLARKASISASTETPYGMAVNIIDGVNRDIADGKSHQWRADFKNGDPWITLKWNRPVRMNKIQLTFDTGLHRFLRISPQDTVYFGQERGPQPETVANYTLEAGRNGEYYSLQKMENNFLRLVTHEFEPITTDTVRIKIHQTNVDELARIFEIRCYME